jgi:hypothetical protein
MNLKKAISNINRSIIKKQPKSIDHKWIKNRCKISYEFIVDNIKDEYNHPDWDFVVTRLERCNQKLWMKGIKKQMVGLYKNKDELNIILDKYRNKLYTFLAQENREDKIICDLVSIKLVRMSQRGNVLAEEKIVELSSHLINQWIENNESLANWKGYNELIIETQEACIRRFRYAGSFVGYLYRTLEYSGRGITPPDKFSLDDISQITGKGILETFVNK